MCEMILEKFVMAVTSKIPSSVLIMYLFTNPISRGVCSNPNASKFIGTSSMNIKK